jgi:hypothetical protein
MAKPWPRSATLWCERWKSLEERLGLIESGVRKSHLSVVRGGPYDRWDLEVWSGLLGGARSLSAVEEHGAGKQLIRFRSWPVISLTGTVLVFMLSAFSLAAARDGAAAVSVALGLGTLILGLRSLQECGVSSAALHESLQSHDEEPKSDLSKTQFCREEPLENPGQHTGLRTACSEAPVPLQEAANSRQ